jgi:type I restriction enzyme M protein
MNDKLQIQIEGNKIFTPLKNKWLQLTPEEKVRQVFITRLVNYYGYDLNQMDQELKVNKSKRGQGRASADIVIWRSEKDKSEDNSAFIVIECKAESVKIMEEDYFQGYNYASWAGAEFFVTTNEKETKFFEVIKGKLPKDLSPIKNIPNASDVYDEKKLEKIKQETIVFERDEFSKLLFKCHNIIRNNDKLSPEAAFDEISKILFIKIRYERSNTESQIFSQKEFKKAKDSYEKFKPKDGVDFYQFLFEQTKEDLKDDELFDINEKIRIRENSFEEIVKELERYNLSNTSDDVKGIAFEQFLGRTFRGELGQFFTPRTIVDFMVEILDPQEGETICDPACGSGGFLIKAFEYVREKIEKSIQKEKERLKKLYFTDEFDTLPQREQDKINNKINDLFMKLNYELVLKNKNSRLRKLSYECIFGTDANPRMARTAKMNMIMHGDGHGGVHHHDGLLNVNGIFDERFDIVFTNPPFGSRVQRVLKVTEEDKFKDESKKTKYRMQYGNDYLIALKQVEDNVGTPILELFDVGKHSSLTEVLFMERCLKLLKKGGRMAIVLPEGVLNNANLQRIRDYFESKAKLIFIVSIPQDVFIASGATVKPSLLFFKKFTEKEENEYKKIKDDVTNEILLKFKSDLDFTNIQKADLKEKYKEDRKSTELKKKIKENEELINQLNDQIQNEIKKELKKRFNYEIPVAEVKKAGITSTGAKCENELEPLAIEYTKFRKDKKLWKDNFEKVVYELLTDNKYIRLIAGEKQEIYGK